MRSSLLRIDQQKSISWTFGCLWRLYNVQCTFTFLLKNLIKLLIERKFYWILLPIQPLKSATFNGSQFNNFVCLVLNSSEQFSIEIEKHICLLFYNLISKIYSRSKIWIKRDFCIVFFCKRNNFSKTSRQNFGFSFQICCKYLI